MFLGQLHVRQVPNSVVLPKGEPLIPNNAFDPSMRQAQLKANAHPSALSEGRVAAPTREVCFWRQRGSALSLHKVCCIFAFPEMELQ